jgi:hypothetical protein
VRNGTVLDGNCTIRKDNMPPQTHEDQPYQAQRAGDPAPGGARLASPVSRRSLLRGAAGAGAVGFAAAAGAGAVFAATRPAAPAASPAAGATATADTTAARSLDEPLVVYLRDASTGEFDVFNGTRHMRIRDSRLAGQLLAGLQTAQ